MADEDAELLTATVNEAARLLDCDGAMIYLFDEPSATLRFAFDAGVASPAAQAMLRTLNLPLGSGMFGTALQTGELTSTDDYPSDSRFTHHELADQIVAEVGMRSMVAAPMFATDRPLGVLGVFANRTEAFNLQQQTLLRALAEHAAAAIDNRRLLAELKRTVAARRALDEIARRIADVDDPAEVLQQIVDMASDLLGSDGAHLTVITDDRTALVPMVNAGQTEPAMREWLHRQRFPIPGGINGLAAQLGKAIWTEDYRHDPRLPHEQDDDTVDRLELGAVIVAPLLGPGGEVMGTLAMTYREPRSLDRRDVTLLEELARPASIAMRNSRLYAELREQSALERDLHRQSAELAANEERARLARELHDSVTQALFSMGLTLRTIELLFDRDPAAAQAKLGELRELQNDALAEMRTLIFELRPRALETDGLEQALRNHAGAVSGRTGITVTVVAALPERVALDTEEALYRIAQEALHNVVKHAGASVVDISIHQVGDEVSLSVADDGAGFDPAAVSGNKLGLIAMRQRAERAGGQLTVESVPGEGTRVSVVVPGSSAKGEGAGTSAE